MCVNTASIAAFDGQIGQIAYSASKGAIVGMTLPAARDLAPRSGSACARSRRARSTRRCWPTCPRMPARRSRRVVPFPSRLGRPDEFAALVAHIVENEMLNGEVIRLDGALRMPPR